MALNDKAHWIDRPGNASKKRSQHELIPVYKKLLRVEGELYKFLEREYKKLFKTSTKQKCTIDELTKRVAQLEKVNKSERMAVHSLRDYVNRLDRENTQLRNERFARSRLTK